MLDDVMNNIQAALQYGGALVLVISGIWLFLNLRDGGGGGAQLTMSIVGLVGGAGAMGLSFFLGNLDTSFAGE